MSGFAGHAVFPSIYRDMENPKKYNHMVDVTYIITAVTYSFMAIIGYLMFGQETLQEVYIKYYYIPFCFYIDISLYSIDHSKLGSSR
jgi:amino acid permease